MKKIYAFLMIAALGACITVSCKKELAEPDVQAGQQEETTPPEEAEEAGRRLAEGFPQAEVIRISAATGEGLEDLAAAMRTKRASLRHPDIDYDDDGLQNAMDQLTEYYLQYQAEVCCNDFDGTEYLADIARAVQADLKAAGHEIPHMKLLAWEPEGDFGKVDLLGTDRPPEITRRFERPCTAVAVVLNANASCPAAELDGIITEAVDAVSRKYRLELLIFKKDFFNLGE